MDQKVTDKKVEFRNLSERLRDWLASIQLTFLIIELNQKLGFPLEKQIVIPRLIWKMVAGELAPEKFVSELGRQLEVSPSVARSLAQEIEERLLRPIETLLRIELGIDVKLIYLGTPETTVVAPVSPTPTSQTPTMIASPEVAHPNEVRVAPTPPPIPSRPAPIPPPAPPIQPKASDDIAKETPVPFKIGKIPTWGPPPAPPAPPETSS